MKVKAKWAIKVNGEWHRTGDVFDVDSTAGLLGAVEILKDDPKPAKKKAEAEEAPVKEEAVEPNAEPKPEAEAEPKPKTAARTRKKTTGK